MAERGVDGLSAEELRRGRKAFWDDAYTAALTGPIPAEARRVVEIGCGIGQLVGELLRVAPRLQVIGIDVDRVRVAQALAAMRELPHAASARLLQARGETLPFGTEQLDVVMTSMALMHVLDPPVVLDEVRRVLRPGGVFIAAEPDNLSQRWYFDGLLEDVTTAFAALFRESCRRRLPADLAIGPRVASLVRQAGFVDVAVRVHAGNTSQYETATACAKRWRGVLETIAATLPGASSGAEAHPTVTDCTRAIDAWLADGPPDRLGQCGEAVPVFVTVAQKPA